MATSRTVNHEPGSALPPLGGGAFANKPGREAAPQLPLFAACRSGRLLALTDENAAPAEMFRILANRLAGVRRSIPLKILHVTSSTVGEGKSVIAANLAVTLARRPETRVLLIEGDLRRPSLARLFGVSGAEGIAEWWEHGAEPCGPAIHAVRGTALAVLFAGRGGHSPEILDTPQLPAMLERFGQQFDWIVIDSPPVLPVADAARWAAWADGTLLVMRAGYASRHLVEKAMASLDRARIVAAVLNESPECGAYYSRPTGEEPRTGAAD